jgi:hypothetical protein
MYETLFALSRGTYYIYSFSMHNQKIIVSLYTAYDMSKFFYTVCNGISFNQTKPSEPVILEIGTIEKSDLGDFELINN